MSTKEDIKKLIKNLARQGSFDEIESRFGSKKAAKAREWAEKKKSPASTGQDAQATPSKKSAAARGTDSQRDTPPASTHKSSSDIVVKKASKTDDGAVRSLDMKAEASQAAKKGKVSVKARSTSDHKHKQESKGRLGKGERSFILTVVRPEHVTALCHRTTCPAPPFPLQHTISHNEQVDHFE